MKKWRKEWQEQQGDEADEAEADTEGSSADSGPSCAARHDVTGVDASRDAEDSSEKRRQIISDAFTSRLAAAGVTLQAAGAAALQTLLRTVTGNTSGGGGGGADSKLIPGSKRDWETLELDGDDRDEYSSGRRNGSSSSSASKRTKRIFHSSDDIDAILTRFPIEQIAEKVVNYICSAEKPHTDDSNDGDGASKLLDKIATAVKQKLGNNA